jgi:thiol-disulfide isomerase/thioredoxin
MDANVIGRDWQNALMRKVIIGLFLLVTACGGGATATSVAEGELPPFDSDAFAQRLDESTRPAVVNVWASWCLPCRSEAPLFTAAHDQYGDEVDFIGIDIQDTQSGAADFLEEYGIPYENLFDENADIRSVLGGSGVPITYFVAPGGGLVETHFGIIDEGQLALGLDELVATTG